MTTYSPPRGVESILEAFAAKSDFRDSILGDLSQEFAARAERYDLRAARMWYYREALRTVPHLARHTIAGAGWKGARRMLNVVGLSYVLTMMIQILAGFAVLAVFTITREQLGLGRGGPLAMGVTGAMIISWTLPMIAGYIAASLDDATPMIGAAATGLAWATMRLIIAIIATGGPIRINFSVMLLMSLVATPLVVAVAMFGGSIQVRRRARLAT